MTTPPGTELVLRSARTPAGDVVDAFLGSGSVLATAPPGAVPDAGADTLDLSGYVVLPAPAEPHAHLDKALTWEEFGSRHVDLPGAVREWSAYSGTLRPHDILARARRVCAEYLAAGTTAIRTHANVCSGDAPLTAVHALVALREELRGVLDLQVVFLGRPEGPDELVRDAVAAGADAVGGAPHAATDPAAENDRLLRLAAELGVRMDLHTDETLDPTAASLGQLARRVTATGFAHGVTASHCVSLGMQTGSLLAETIEAVRAAGVGVVTLPITNLYLNGRGLPTSPPRGLTAVRALLDAGVTLGAGGDNVRDVFNPMGRADPLEAASLLVTAGHLTVTEAYDAVSHGARTVLGLPRAGLESGAAADLVAVRATSLDDAVARAPADRIVLKSGAVVARTTVTRKTALD